LCFFEFIGESPPSLPKCEGSLRPHCSPWLASLSYDGAAKENVVTVAAAASPLDLRHCSWVDDSHNPLVEPPRPEWMIADPAVLPADATPDGKWHMYANSVGWIRHFCSADGVAWTAGTARRFQGIRPFLFREADAYYMLYERFLRPWRSGIAIRRSLDLVHWDEPVLLLAGERPADGGLIRFLGNPCLVRHGEEYRLYFSHNWVFLRDCLYWEPRSISLALASSLLGPYVREPAPLFGPDPHDPYFNMGAGSIKLLADGAGGYFGFHNGIYRDERGKSRSALHLVHSRDGRHFERIGKEPIVAPEPGWKRAFVYACCPVVQGGTVHLYYNARDGWFKGSERIGVARAKGA
jgi:hypothetical protein